MYNDLSMVFKESSVYYIPLVVCIMIESYVIPDNMSIDLNESCSAFYVRRLVRYGMPLKVYAVYVTRSDLQHFRFGIPSGPVLKHGPRSLVFVQVIGC